MLLNDERLYTWECVDCHEEYPHDGYNDESWGYRAIEVEAPNDSVDELCKTCADLRRGIKPEALPRLSHQRKETGRR